MKKLSKAGKAVAIAGASLFITAAAGAGYYLNSPSNLVSIDVNPSIELHTNRLGYVVSIDPVNSDAEQLMAGYQLTDRDLESVIQDIVDRMIFSGYLVSPTTNQILVSADENTSTDLLNRVDTAFNDYLQEKQLDVAVLDQTVDMNSDNLASAHQNDVSVGKMAIIDKLTENDRNVTAQDLADYSVKELISLAISQGISLEDLISNYNEALSNAALTPTDAPTAVPTATPTDSPTAAPTAAVDAVPSVTPAADGTTATTVDNNKTSSITVTVDAVSSATMNTNKNDNNTDNKVDANHNKTEQKKVKSTATSAKGDASVKDSNNEDSSTLDSQGNSDYENQDTENVDSEDANDNEDSNKAEYEADDQGENNQDASYDSSDNENDSKDSSYSNSNYTNNNHSEDSNQEGDQGGDD